MQKDREYKDVGMKKEKLPRKYKKLIKHLGKVLFETKELKGKRIKGLDSWEIGMK